MSCYKSLLFIVFTLLVLHFPGRNETLLHTAASSNVQDDETEVLRLQYNIKDSVISGETRYPQYPRLRGGPTPN